MSKIKKNSVKSYALLSYDPDLPRNQTWIHWIICHIPPDINYLPPLRPIDQKTFMLDDRHYLVQGVNSWGRFGWGGPCPGQNLPHVPHRYHFVIYALDTIITNCDNFLQEIKDHTISQGCLTGTYLRPILVTSSRMPEKM